jgi:hypothetical protein
LRKSQVLSLARINNCICTATNPDIYVQGIEVGTPARIC